jgi:hypothetical protein
MSLEARSGGLLLLLCLLGLPQAAAAGGNGLVAVERAYHDVDFELTLRLSEEELAKGGHEVAETARLELLRGLASAALGRHELAYRAFVRMLAIEPERRLDRELSPKMRAPYLEARGYWGSFSERLNVRVDVEEGVLAVSVIDPAGLVARVRVELDGPHGSERREQSKPAGSWRVSLRAPERPAAYSVTLLDQHGNALLQRRSALPERPATPNAAQSSSSSRGQHLDASRTPLILASVGFAVLGAGAATIAVLAHQQREQKADEWNGATCERPGATRGEQCAAIRDEIRERERWAIGMYAASGALFAGSLITLVLAPSAQEANPAARVAARCGTGFLSLQCSGSF